MLNVEPKTMEEFSSSGELLVHSINIAENNFIYEKFQADSYL